MGRVYYVPWIDAFAELIGQKISVRWSDDSDRIFRVSDADGIIEANEDEAMDGQSFAP